MSPALYYRYGASTVCSTLALPALPAALAGTTVAYCIDRTLQACPADIHWRHHWHDGDDVVLSLAQLGTDYWLRMPDLADFLFQPDAGRILVAPDACADDTTLEHLLVDQVLPRLLAHRGHLVLHASAVTLHGRHALFLGKSGWGKSTLAGLLQQRGHAVHSDDCVQLRVADGRHEAVPTYPSLRLYPDSLDTLFPDTVSTAPVASYSEKLRVPLQRPEGTNSAVPVAALYVLVDPATAGAAVRISALRPSQACQALIGHSFRLDLGDRAGNAAHLARCAAMVNDVPVFRLDYQRDFTQSAALVEAITRHLSSLPTPS